MFKCKLPKDWITLTSKSHPDRVYYFNVKTNESTWIVPTSGNANKTSVRERVRDKEHRRAMTPEHNPEEEATSSQRTSNAKTIETPQMKAVRAKALQRANAKNKSPLSEAPCGKSAGNSRKTPPTNLSSKTDDKLLETQGKNDNKVIFTPQMQALHEKIKRKNANTPNLNKTSKEVPKSKEQSFNTVNQKPIKVSEKREEHVGNRESSVRNKRNIPHNNKNRNTPESYTRKVSRERWGKRFPRNLPKNLAKERLQKLRKSLSVDKEICNDSSGSTHIHKNVDVRLKRLRNRILKDAVYERNITLSSTTSQSQQSQESKVMTKDKLIEQGEQQVLYEEMDWEPMKDEEITSEVEAVRTQLSSQDHVDETNCVSQNTAELTQPNRAESREKSPLYIVVDTNVFLVNLEIIQEARDTTFKNYPRPFIVIPWTVICELDYLKENKDKHELAMKARKAISFIHDQFSSNHPRIVGQTREQAAKNKEDFSLSCPDDEILQCCLQIHQLQKSVVLLSYDKNLSTKAMIYNILALGRNDPLEKIDHFDSKGAAVNHLNDGLVENSIFNEELRLTDDIFEDIKLIIKDLLSTIITKQMSEIYGNEWKMYTVIKPPWTTVTALKCAMKHWIAAINESFHRRAETVLKELFDAFVYVPVGVRKLRDVEYIIEKSSDLVQMVNVDKHCDLMTQTFNAITELKKKCQKYVANIDLKHLQDKIGVAKNSEEEEMRAEKAFQCFQYIYNFARDFCGLACSNAGMAHSFAFKSMNPPLLQGSVQLLQSEMTKNVTDLANNLNKLLVQAEDSIKYQTLLSLQENLNTFLPDTQRVTFDLAPLDVYYCVKLKEETLKTGLRQLQELISHFCALAAHAT